MSIHVNVHSAIEAHAAKLPGSPGTVTLVLTSDEDTDRMVFFFDQSRRVDALLEACEKARDLLDETVETRP
ncbi:MAG: hypothetical protein GY795_24525 [Desulfobacterales bacterium]|nr:hypothetical protein [Desulfobacterales bacterium]